MKLTSQYHPGINEGLEALIGPTRPIVIQNDSAEYLREGRPRIVTFPRKLRGNAWVTKTQL
jgi:hypothetical protein